MPTEVNISAEALEPVLGVAAGTPQLPPHVRLADASLPANYEQANTALLRCASIDECRGWTNKAEALAAYAHMAQDDTLLRLAERVQARAVRRVAELLKQSGEPRRLPEKGTGGRSSFQAIAAADTGVRQRPTEATGNGATTAAGPLGVNDAAGAKSPPAVSKRPNRALQLPAHINAADARLPASYEQARGALLRCVSIDECRGWANQAEALAAYGRMARDATLLRLAERIQARAVGAVAELLEQPGEPVRLPENGTGTRLAFQAIAAGDAGVPQQQKGAAAAVVEEPDNVADRSVAASGVPGKAANEPVEVSKKPPKAVHEPKKLAAEPEPAAEEPAKFAGAPERSDQPLKVADEHVQLPQAWTQAVGEPVRLAELVMEAPITTAKLVNKPANVVAAALAVESESPAGATRLTQMSRPARSVPDSFGQSRQLPSTVKRFAEFCRDYAPEGVAGEVKPRDVPNVKQHVATIEAWLGRFVVKLRD